MYSCFHGQESLLLDVGKQLLFDGRGGGICKGLAEIGLERQKLQGGSV